MTGFSVGGARAHDSAQPATQGPLAAWFAHGARVWDCAFLQDEIVPPARGCNGPRGGEMAARLLAIASCGEDGAVKLWRVSVPPHGVQGDGVLAGRPGSEAPSGAELITTLRGHAGKHVWCVAARPGTSSSPVLLVSGGADGSSKTWPLHAHLPLQLAPHLQPAASDATGSSVKAGLSIHSAVDSGTGKPSATEASGHDLSGKAASADRATAPSRARSHEADMSVTLSPSDVPLDGAHAIDATSPIRALALLDGRRALVASGWVASWAPSSAPPPYTSPHPHPRSHPHHHPAPLPPCHPVTISPSPAPPASGSPPGTVWRVARTADTQPPACRQRRCGAAGV